MPMDVSLLQQPMLQLMHYQPRLQEATLPQMRRFYFKSYCNRRNNLYSWTGLKRDLRLLPQNLSITNVTTKLLSWYLLQLLSPTETDGDDTATTNVTITALPTATISYTGAPYCTTVSAAQNVTLTGDRSIHWRNLQCCTVGIIN